MVFAGIHWLLPAVAGSNTVLRLVAQQLSSLAGWFAVLFLLPAPFAFYKSYRRRRVLDRQSGIDSIRTLSWQQFEQLVSECYRGQGYTVHNRGGAGPDGGVDVELRIAAKKLVVQCKQWKTQTVGVVPVRELYGAMSAHEAHGAIFVTSGRYTPDAI